MSVWMFEDGKPSARSALRVASASAFAPRSAWAPTGWETPMISAVFIWVPVGRVAAGRGPGAERATDAARVTGFVATLGFGADAATLRSTGLATGAAGGAACSGET